MRHYTEGRNRGKKDKYYSEEERGTIIKRIEEIIHKRTTEIKKVADKIIH